MDNALQAFLSWQFILFCLAIAAITFVARQFVEYFTATNAKFAAKESKLWKELILPILPIIVGCLGGWLAKKYPFPEELHSVSGRVVFGSVAGLLSGLVFRVAKTIIGAKLGNSANISSLPPAPPTSPQVAEVTKNGISDN